MFRPSLVVFASKNSVESPWVREEIAIAADKAAAGKILRRAVVLLDGLDRSNLPSSLLTYTAVKYSDPSQLARRIQSILWDAGASSSENSHFIGRDSDNLKLKGSLIPVDGLPPTSVFLTGMDGIGKRTLLARALSDCFPHLPKKLRIVNVFEAAGPADIYIRLVGEGLQLRELAELVDKFKLMTMTAQIEELGQKIESIARSKDTTVLYGAEHLKTEEGDLVPWVNDLIRRLTPVGHPSLFLLSRFQLAPQHRNASESLLYMAIHSIDGDDSQRLLAVLLSERGIRLPSSAMSKLAQATEGHPGQVLRAAKLVSTDAGVSGALLTSQLIDAISNPQEVARLLKLDETSLSIVAIFSEFGLMSSEDIYGIIDDDFDATKALSSLIERCVIEPVGDLFRVAPFLQYSLRRISYAKGVAGLIKKARTKLAKRLQSFSIDDVVSVNVLDQSVVAWLGVNDDLPELLHGMLLPASLLRAATSAYDGGSWERASVLAKRAIEGEWTLTSDALAAAFRLRGLSLARINERVEFEKLIKEFSSNTRLLELGKRFINRNVEFLLGFMARLDGRYKEAVAHFDVHRKNGGDSNFKSLREYAYVLFRLDRLHEAEAYARKAHESAPGNPHVVGLLADILATDALQNKKGITSELQDLADELVGSDRSTGANFATPLLVKIELLRGNPDVALRLVSTATGKGVGKNFLGLEKAEVLMRLGQYQNALDQVENTMAEARVSLRGRERKLRPMAASIRIAAYCELKRPIEAEDVLKRERSYLSDQAVAKAVRLIGYAKMEKY